jgi:hypothetical protein
MSLGCLPLRLGPSSVGGVILGSPLFGISNWQVALDYRDTPKNGK